MAGSLLWATLAAFAADRPFLATASAVAEEDDDGVWSVETWFQRDGARSTLVVAPGYAFDPTTSVQFEVSRELDRANHAGRQGAEIEFKHLFNHIARDGYGIGVALSIAAERMPASPWRRAEVSLNVPLTMQLGSDGLLWHLNAGLNKPRGERRTWTSSTAFEYEVARHTTWFAEGARNGGEQLLQSGVRYWIRREKVALDLSWYRKRDVDMRASGIVAGLGLYDW